MVSSYHCFSINVCLVSLLLIIVFDSFLSFTRSPFFFYFSLRLQEVAVLRMQAQRYHGRHGCLELSLFQLYDFTNHTVGTKWFCCILDLLTFIFSLVYSANLHGFFNRLFQRKRNHNTKWWFFFKSISLALLLLLIGTKGNNGVFFTSCSLFMGSIKGKARLHMRKICVLGL